MKELEFLEIINKTLDDNSYLGDDCAYLNEFGLYVTQDTLVEDVHFSLKYSTPYQIGYKAVMVNLSDLASNLAQPKYISVSVSLPKSTDNKFVKDLYKGINDACVKYHIVVIGGDITGSDKVIISICALGKKISDYCANHSSAQIGDVVVLTGSVGTSAAGLRCLANNIDNDFLKNKHFYPTPKIQQAQLLIDNISRDIACIDLSDGLMDALYKITNESNVSADIVSENIPYDKNITIFHDYKDLMLFGGEDYELLACISEQDYKKLDKRQFIKIGKIISKQKSNIIINNQTVLDTMLQNSFDHFE